MSKVSVSRSRRRGGVLAVAMLAVGCLVGCGPKPASQNPIPAGQMADYDKMMKGGGMRPPGAMPAQPGSGAPMQPQMAPGTPMAPNMAPGR